MSTLEENKLAPYINVTPLIDVLLVLLIIFMVVTPLKPGRFKALIPAPPEPDERPRPARDDLLRVDVLDDLRLKLNGQDVGRVGDTAELSSVLVAIFQKRTAAGYTKFGTDKIEKTVYIKAARSTRYGKVVEVIDAVKGAGADPVGLQVDELAQ